MHRSHLTAAAVYSAVIGLGASAAFAQDNFKQNNLVSDLPNMAEFQDPNLVNPWGISEGPTTPFWIANNGTGTTTLYNGAGVPQALVVTLPGGGGGDSAPTGTVFNGSSAFNGDRFLFAGEDGAITGWRGSLGTHGEIIADDSASGAVFKGLAIGTVGTSTYLYATDFHNNQIDYWSSGPALTGTFTDTMGLPAGYAPFNIQNIGGSLYVTYALQDADAHDDVAGLGNGFIDVYSLNGDFERRLVSNGALDSPWGLAWAPSGFGSLAGDLLVGNFGNGLINAYDPTSGDWVGTLNDAEGNPIWIPGLWGLSFGNGTAAGGSTGTLYFTAGIPGPDGAVEDHGLFGDFTAVPEASTVWSGVALMAGAVVTFLRRRTKRAV